MYVGIITLGTCVQGGQKRALGILDLDVQTGLSVQQGCLELKLGLLQEQNMFFTTKPSLSSEFL